jgi:hypothetical protein
MRVGNWRELIVCYSDIFLADCIFYSHLSRYSMDWKRSNSINLGATMGNKNFKRLVICATLGLLLAVISASALAQGRDWNTRVFSFQLTPSGHRVVEVHKADGSIVMAEVLGEIDLNLHGRANGALGLHELGPGAPLTAYRILAGQAIDDTVFTFSAQRLSLPAGPVTITLRRLANPHAPTSDSVTITFVVTVDQPFIDEDFTFVTEGQLLSKPTELPSITDLLIDRFAYVNAQSQTVLVQTPRGSYTANFTNVALVFPSVGAIGWLELAPPEGSSPGSDQTFGIWQIIDGRVLNIPQGKFIVMRPRPRDTSVSNVPQGWFSLGPAPVGGEQIYDIYASRGSGVLKFEAQADITTF